MALGLTQPLTEMSRARSEPGGTRWRTGGEVKGKLANGVGSKYSYATSERGLSSITQADAHTSAASSRTDAPTDLNGLVRFGERRNLVSARVPSGSARAIPGIFPWGVGGVKMACAEGWQPYHLQAPIVLKSVSLKLREPSGPVQASNGIDLPIFMFVVLVLMVVASVLIGIRLPINSASYPRRTESSATRNKLSRAVSRSNVAHYPYAWQRERIWLNLFAAKTSTKIKLQYNTCKNARVELYP